MKSKLLILLIALLSLLCLFSCGGDDNKDDKGEYKTVTFNYGENNSKSSQMCFYEDSTKTGELNYSTEVFGYNLVGFYTAEGIQYFDKDAKKLDNIIIDKDLTVFAKYEPKEYIFTFDAQAGMLDDGSSKRDVIVTVEADLKSSFPKPSSANPNFEFDG